LIFVVAGLGHFTRQEIAYAAAQDIPLASVLVPVSGIMAIVGGLCILLGFHGKLGAWLLVLFLVPVTFTMHNFWAVKDPMMQQAQMAMFLKNISAGFGTFLRANRNGPAKPRFAWRAGSLIQNYDVELSRSAFFV